MLPARPSLRATLSFGDDLRRRGFRARRAGAPPPTPRRRRAPGRARYQAGRCAGRVDRHRQRERAGVFLRHVGRLRPAPPRCARQDALGAGTFFDSSFSGDQSTATLRATSHGPSSSSMTRLPSDRLPDHMPSSPGQLDCLARRRDQSGHQPGEVVAAAIGQRQHQHGADDQRQGVAQRPYIRERRMIWIERIQNAWPTPA